MSMTTTKTAEEGPFHWTTCIVPTKDFHLPKDFKLPPGLEPVPISEDSPTEVPQATSRDYSNYKYKHFLPFNTVTSEPPLTPYTHIDPGSRANPSKASLFSVLQNRRDITPSIGTEITNYQLSSLTPQQKDELALYAAERGLLVFRNQDFVEHSAEWMKDFGSHFGRLHVHPFGTHVKDHPELVTNFRDTGNTFFDAMSRDMLTTTLFHSDMSYEVNPVGTTFLAALNTPPCGGDTLYLSTTRAYTLLSPAMQAFLSTLTAIHSGTRQSLTSRTTNLYRRPPIDTVHPVIRTHPVTGQRAIWVNREYTTRIVELKKEESDALLGLLFAHLERSLDFHTRVRWEEGTVVCYDNRVVLHSAMLDYELGKGEEEEGKEFFRHLIRVTPQAEVPFFK